MIEIEHNIDVESLSNSATRVRTLAYAPYSQFRVGALLLAASGNAYVGRKIENVSFGLTICAEHAYISAAIVPGDQNLRAIALVADTQSPLAPCGASGQVLTEFNPRSRHLQQNSQGRLPEMCLCDLLPRPLSRILRSPKPFQR
jgi:cytidine deaminase